VALTAIDRDLLNRCLAREPGSWKDFVDRFVGLILHVIRHTAASRNLQLHASDLDDCCAEVFLEIVAKDFAILRHFEGNSSLATYLTVVSRRICVRFLMTRKPLPYGTAVADSITDTRSDTQKDVDNREQLEKMLDQIAGKEADVVRLFHLEGKSYLQISEELNIPQNTVGSILSRARSKMRRTAHDPPE